MKCCKCGAESDLLKNFASINKCLKCAREYRKEYYHKNKTEQKEYHKKYMREYRMKKFVVVIGGRHTTLTYSDLEKKYPKRIWVI